MGVFLQRLWQRYTVIAWVKISIFVISVNFTEEFQLTGGVQILMGSVLVFKEVVYSEPLLFSLLFHMVDSQVSQVGLSVIVQMVAIGRRLHCGRASLGASGEILQTETPDSPDCFCSQVWRAAGL